VRQVSLIMQNQRQRLRSRIAKVAASFLPVFALRRLMEHTFINFGVETTNLCNANCSFCGYRYMQRPKLEMSWNLYKKAVDDFVDSGGGNLNFTPTVGDPLVDRDLVKKIQYARSQARIGDIFLYTNAILIQKFGCETLLKSGLSRLAISTFIGSREGYLKYYGNDKYERVVQNILDISQANLKLESPVRITLHLRVEGSRKLWQGTKTYKKIAKLIGEENIDYLDIYDAWGGLIKKDDVPEGTFLDEPLPLKEKIVSPCFELYRRLHVLADGNVGACVCVDLESEIKVGNLNTHTLQDIWRGPALRRYRTEWRAGKLPKVCQTCTRYEGVDTFIKKNRKRVVIDFMRRQFPKLLDQLTR